MAPVTTHYDTATPYIAAYVIFRRDNKIAFVLREHTKWMNGYYGLPSGKVELGESFSAAAIREAREETGVIVLAEDLRYLLTVHRLDGDSTWVDICFEATKWDGEPYNAEPEIHSKLTWLDPTDLLKNVVPSVRFMLEQIQAGKTYAEYGW